jgi:hypothetical protein
LHVKAHRMNLRCLSLRNILILLLILFLQQWTPSAVSASHRKSLFAFSHDPFFKSSQLRTPTHIAAMLNGASAVADFDGDDKPDIALARLRENQYEIVVFLNTHLDMILSSSFSQLKDFTLHAYDISQDNNQDVILTSPNALHPLAVWLGDGNGGFKSADRSLFKNDFTVTESSRFQNRYIPLSQELLTVCSNPLCEKLIRAFEGSPLERDGFLACKAHFCALRYVCLSIALRSPPPGNPI